MTFFYVVSCDRIDGSDLDRTCLGKVFIIIIVQRPDIHSYIINMKL